MYEPQILNCKIDALGLSKRVDDLLSRYANIEYVYELVEMTEVEVLRTPAIGKKSVDEIKEALAGHNLRLGARLLTAREQIIDYLDKTGFFEEVERLVKNKTLV